MDSNNEPPKKPAKAKTSKPRTSKAKSTATVLGVDPNTIDEPMRTLNSEYKPADAGIPTSENSPTIVPTPAPKTYGLGYFTGDPIEVQLQKYQELIDADKQQTSVQSSPVETQPLPKEQTQEANVLDSTTSEPTEDAKNTGDVADPVLSADSNYGAKSLESLPFARVRDGETKSQCWERLRREGRAAGMTRRGAIAYAGVEVDRLFPPAPPPAPVIVEELPDDSELKPAEPASIAPPAEPVSQKTVEETAKSAPAADLGVVGLGEIPESWPSLPANAQLQVEIAWVSANRLRVRSGNGVDLARALSPAPSYSALSWLETSILFPAKFADISVKATVDQDDEREFIKREKLAIEEIRSILKEMLDAKT